MSSWFGADVTLTDVAVAASPLLVLLLIGTRIGWVSWRRRSIRQRLRRAGRAAAVEGAWVWTRAWRSAVGAGLPTSVSPDVVASDEAYEPDLRSLARMTTRAAFAPDTLPRMAGREAWELAYLLCAHARAGAPRRRRLALLLTRGLDLPARRP